MSTESVRLAERNEHPPQLEEFDRPYFVPWGRRDVLELGLRTGGLAVGILVVSWAAAMPILLALEVPLFVVFLCGLLFFRNPRRTIPSDRSVLVAPADGKIADVGVVTDGDFIDGPALQVGIFLSILDVHVNRAPGAGEVEHLQYRPGKFYDARDPRCVTENESQTMGIRLRSDAAGRAGDRILVRQISGAIARRIICPLVVGQRVSRGGLIGMIKYGSRTELTVPIPAGDADERWEVAVKVGQRVRAGQSVLFRRVSLKRSN